MVEVDAVRVAVVDHLFLSEKVTYYLIVLLLESVSFLICVILNFARPRVTQCP